MLNLFGPSSGRLCDGITRRDMLRIGGLALGGLSLPQMLAAEELAGIKRSHKAVIMIYLAGAPPHQDMVDLKMDAPIEIRGPHRPMRSACPDIDINDRLPLTARIMDKVSVVRSVHHDMTNHNSAGYYALTGKRPPTDDQRLRESIDLDLETHKLALFTNSITPNFSSDTAYAVTPGAVRPRVAASKPGSCERAGTSAVTSTAAPARSGAPAPTGSAGRAGSLAAKARVSAKRVGAGGPSLANATRLSEIAMTRLTPGRKARPAGAGGADAIVAISFPNPSRICLLPFTKLGCGLTKKKALNHSPPVV
jgi:hypothetical protein